MSELLERDLDARPRSGKAGAAVRLLLGALAATAAAAAYVVFSGAGHPKAAAPVAVAAIPVTVGAATTRDLPIWLAGIGSVQPLNMVNVKVRVDGQLMRVAFTEGQEVHAGDLLAQIDARPYAAQLAAAEANRAKDQAQLATARVDLARASKLAGMGAGTGQNVDTLKGQVAALDATVQADQAAIDTATLNVGFTTITAPIAGRVGMRQIDPGSIVHATDPSGLVTVTQMQPIAVVFALPQDDLPAVLAGQAKGTLPVAVDTRDGAHHLADGSLVFIDSQVDPTNGQVRLKATFTNADRALWPGEFISARVLVRTDRAATVVPARAVLRGQNGTYVYLLKPDGTVQPQPVKTGPSVDGYIAVLSGVHPGDSVILDGQSRLAPGTRVDAKQTPATAAGPAS